jgi:hypothetical protein
MPVLHLEQESKHALLLRLEQGSTYFAQNASPHHTTLPPIAALLMGKESATGNPTPTLTLRYNSWPESIMEESV